jgi:replicative DNA helicase
LDKYIGGFVPGENVVVAGRPGMGKTAFAVSIGIAHAKLGGRVIMFSMEMSKEQLADRILSSLGRVDNLKVRNADVNEFELENIARELLLIDYKFQIEDSTMLDISQIKTRIKTMKIKPTLVIIDYMQLVKSTGGKNREQEIANISRQCKLIAKECGCTVMPLSQLNRGTEEGNSRPKLANLRESGAIEQDADTVLFPYRPDYYEAQKNGGNPPELENAELIISKCRNGMTGTLQCNFMGKTVEYIF